MSAAVEVLQGTWGLKDYLGAMKVRLGLGRKNYKTNPGLYALGEPDEESPVLVTANYKLSVDHVRRAVSSRDVWLLVLDTRGVNVWCAAGKGTFGTEELIRRIESVTLGRIVSHRKIILPQLGAPGTAAHEIRKETGFTVVYGPVEAKDLPDFLDAGCRASEEMRRKRFPAKERLAVSLTHCSQGLVYTAGFFLLFILLDLLLPGGSPADPAGILMINGISVLGALLSGTILTGLLLPVLPGRAFSIKGFSAALLFTAGAWFLFPAGLYSAGKLLLLDAWIVFQALNLTGSSTYTSLSGVRKEMAAAIPLLAAGAAAGLILTITGGLIQ